MVSPNVVFKCSIHSHHASHSSQADADQIFRLEGATKVTINYE